MKELISILFILLFSSCTKDTYSKKEITNIAKQFDPSFEEVIPREMTGGIKCSDYGPGCIRGFTGRVHGLDMIFIEFESEDDAKIEATRIDQYYKWNWVFDDVSNEPMLEKFIEKNYQAHRPFKKSKDNQTQE